MATSMEKCFGETLDTFNSITRNPEDFVTIHQGHANKLSKTIKLVYDTKKSVDPISTSSTSLSELIVENFDEEQVWQQLELENESLVTDLIAKVARIFSDKTACSFSSENSSESAFITKGNIGSVDKTGKSSKKFNKTKKNKSKIENDSEEDSDELEDEFGDNTEEIGSDLDDSDEELDKIQSRLEAGDESNEEDDKFFDFTGDSDDDLNFDFGPLSKKGQQIEEGIFDGDENKDEKSKETKKKGKKSVTFKDEVNEETLFKDKDKGSSMKGKAVKGIMNKLNKKRSIVDDKFFKLHEMEAFLDLEDQREARKNKPEKSDNDDDNESDDGDDDDDEEEIDMFGDIPSGDEDYHYDDFFDAIDGSDDEGHTAPGKKADDDDGGDDDGGDDDDDDDDDDEGEEDGSDENEKSSSRDENYNMPAKKPKDLFGDSESEGEDAEEILGHKQQHKSTYEIRQEKLKKKILDMEAASLVEKPWQLMGEVGGTTRPENSLLQENLQFELTSRLAPEITEETTQTLEQLIKQRIKDKSWNDVERKVKPKENPIEYKKRITLDQEKSKQSLGEIYEQEYLKQQEKEEEKEPVHKDHEEIKKMMQSLFIKLDALSNFHYTPKQIMPEVKIVADQPTINIEEVAPVSVSEKTLLAPEEIQEKPKGELKGDTEKTKTDNLRARRNKKTEKRKKKQEKANQRKLIDKLNPGLGNKYSKERALKQLEKDSKAGKNNLTMIKGDTDKTNLTSSKAFFTQLQDEVRANINSKKEDKRKKQSDHSVNAKKFKL